MNGHDNKGFRPFPAVLWQTVVIVLLGSSIGLAINGVRESGIPLVGSVRVVKFDTPVATTPPERDEQVPSAVTAEAGIDPGAVAAVDPGGEAVGPGVTAPQSTALEVDSVEPPAAVALPVAKTEPAAESGGVEVFSPLPVAESAEEVVGGPLALDLAQALELFEGGMAVFVDARNPDEFAAGHIPGAFNLPYDELEAHLDVLNYLTDDGLVVTYCDGSECESSLELADELSAMGFGQVRVFFGGWEQWLEAGYVAEEGEALLPY